MKRLLSLSLMLLMLFGVAAPAMAYTQNVATDVASRYSLELSLIEYDGTGDIFSGMFRQKPTDRAYAKNEIVAAVGKLTVPARANLCDDGYFRLQFTARNMTFNVMENRNRRNIYLMQASNNSQFTEASFDPTKWEIPAGNEDIIRHALHKTTDGNIIPVSTSKRTYSFLVFAKVTKDNARLTFEATREIDFDDVAAGAWTTQGAFSGHAVAISQDAAVEYLVLNDDYIVFRTNKGHYVVFENDESGNSYDGTTYPKGDPLFRVEVDSRGRTTRLYMYTRDESGPIYRIYVEPSERELIFSAVGNSVRGMAANDQVKFNSSTYKSLLRTYQNHFEDGLGFSAYYEGNIMDDEDWEKISQKLNLSATVNLEPMVDYPRR